MEEFDERIEVAATQYGGLDSGTIIGAIINHVPDPEKLTLAGFGIRWPNRAACSTAESFHLVGAIPQNPELTACRTIDIARHLGADVLHDGEIQTRRVKKISVLARTVPNMLHVFPSWIHPGDTGGSQ